MSNNVVAVDGALAGSGLPEPLTVVLAHKKTCKNPGLCASAAGTIFETYLKRPHQKARFVAPCGVGMVATLPCLKWLQEHRPLADGEYFAFQVDQVHAQGIKAGASIGTATIPRDILVLVDHANAPGVEPSGTAPLLFPIDENGSGEAPLLVDFGMCNWVAKGVLPEVQQEWSDRKWAVHLQMKAVRVSRKDGAITEEEGVAPALSRFAYQVASERAKGFKASKQRAPGELAPPPPRSNAASKPEGAGTKRNAQEELDGMPPKKMKAVRSAGPERQLDPGSLGSLEVPPPPQPGTSAAPCDEQPDPKPKTAHRPAAAPATTVPPPVSQGDDRVRRRATSCYDQGLQPAQDDLAAMLIQGSQDGMQVDVMPGPLREDSAPGGGAPEAQFQRAAKTPGPMGQEPQQQEERLQQPLRQLEERLQQLRRQLEERLQQQQQEEDEDWLVQVARDSDFPVDVDGEEAVAAWDQEPLLNLVPFCHR